MIEKDLRGILMERLLNNLLSGAASIMMLLPASPVLQVRAVTDGRTDRDALQNDVNRIGGDFNKVIDVEVHDKE